MKRKILIFSLRLLAIAAVIVLSYIVGDIETAKIPYQMHIVAKTTIGLLHLFLYSLVFLIVGGGLYCMWPNDSKDDAKLQDERDKYNYTKNQEKFALRQQKKLLESPDYDPLQLVKSKYESNNL